jgi:hypothetical protein
LLTTGAPSKRRRASGQAPHDIPPLAVARVFVGRRHQCHRWSPGHIRGSLQPAKRVSGSVKDACSSARLTRLASPQVASAAKAGHICSS